MRRSRFSDDRIIAILKEHAAGGTSELFRKRGIGDATFCKWRSRCGGTEPSDANRVRAPEEENGRLKKLSADSVLDVSTLRKTHARRR